MNPPAPSQGFYARSGKHLLDLALALAATATVSPLLVVLAALVRLNLGSPVLFRQVRPGLTGRPFVLFKFRTMTNLRDKNGHFLSDAARLTRLGRWMRNWSLDELPELFNVLKGEMSLVGPRPLLPQYLDLYTPEQARRHEVKPGLTGWAQIKGRNAISWEEKFALDIWYVDHLSFSVDARIMLLTAVKVLKREGISAETDVTMPEFMGSPPSREKGKDA